MKPYGQELILDIHNCDITKFNRPDLAEFLGELCKLIDMEQVECHWWIDHESKEEHVRGVSVVQLINTSNIALRCKGFMHCIEINIFSCKEFNAEVARRFCLSYFGGDLGYIKEN